jgi:small-conductance mechanosensitive channel
VTAPVLLDGVTLFRVAVAVQPPAGFDAIELRATDIATSVAQVVATQGTGARRSTAYDPRTLRVHIRRAADLASLEVVDALHPDPLPIVTVTSVDAQYNGASIEAVATQWQQILQSALTRSLQLRQPAVERQSLRDVAVVAALLLVASGFQWLAARALRRRIELLRAELASRDRATHDEAEDAGAAPEEGGEAVRRRKRVLAWALGSVAPERRMRRYRAIVEGSLWLLLLAWFGAFGWAISLFPEATPLAARLTQSAFGVTATLLVAALLNRILDVVIDRAAAAWGTNSFSNSDDRARQLLRIPTAARAVAGFKTFALVFFAVLATLGQLGLPIGSVVTIGGLTAVALSLAAQNFVRDFVNGTLVLVEDQYVVGDYVTINSNSGIVERLTLRMVQLRDASGNLVTLPHSSVTTVINQSRNWSRVDYRVPVDPAADLPRAIDAVRGAIEELANEPQWRDVVLGPIEWIGLDALSRDAAVVRASVRTAPLRQFELRREINARVGAAFHRENIALGVPPAPA